MANNLISVTKSATQKLLQISRDNNTKGILFFIKSGGCNGFEYKFKPINNFTNDENIYTDGELNIEVCDKSLFYLLGTNIDWNEDIMGQGFKFDNPLAKNSCGCGSSFNPIN